MTIIYHDNTTGTVIKERGGVIKLPSGKTILVKGAKPNPALDLYNYVEEGPRRARPGKMIKTETVNDGYHYKVIRAEVHDPYFDLDGFKAKKIAKIKQEAGAVILARFPDWKQRNMNMRATELQEIRLTGGPLTESEHCESLFLQAAANWIKTVRQASNQAETILQSLDTLNEVESFLPLWPDPFER